MAVFKISDLTASTGVADGDLLEVETSGPASEKITVTQLAAANAFVSQFVSQATITAKGDIVVGTAVGTPGVRTVGSDGQYLVASSLDTTGMEWATPSWVDASDYTAKGALVVGDGVGSYDTVTVGANDQALVADSSTATGVAWKDVVLESVVDAKGDLLIGSAADTVTRFAVGGDGYVLAADSTTGSGLKWIPAPVSPVIINAKGDLIVGSADDAPVILSVGTNGQVLTANSAALYGVNWATPSVDIPVSTVDAKGDLIVGTANDTVSRLAVGTNGHALVADSAAGTGVKWAAVGDVTLSGSQTLTNKTLTSPTINSATIDSSAITFGTADEMVLISPEERWTVSATAATGTVNVDVKTSAAWLYTSNASANWTFNLRGNGTTTLSSMLATGDSVTVVFAVTQGSIAYYPTVFQVDGSSVTPKWQNAVAPSAGNPSSIDVYTFTVVKTAATPSYTVFASQTQFK